MPSSSKAMQQQVTLGSIASERKSKSTPSASDDRPYVALEHIAPDCGGLLGRDTAANATSDKTEFQRGDVLFGKLRPKLRKCVRVDFDGVCSTDILALHPKNGLDAKLLLHIMRSDGVMRHAVATAIGTKMPRTSWNALAKCLVTLPPKQLHQVTADALDAIDDDIDGTRAVIHQTRTLRTAVLQDLLSNGLPGRQNGHQKVRWLGQVPKNWRLCTLGDLVREPVRNGYSPNCPNRPTGRWVLSLSAVTSDGYRPTGVKPAPLDDPKVLETQLVPGDILVSRSNTRNLVGLAGVYDGTPANCSYPDLLMRVRIDSSKANPDYVLAVLLSGGSRSYFAQTSRGTSGSMKKIDREILENLPVPLPTPDDQDAIVRVSDSFGRRIRQETVLLKRAVQLKKALSQALLTVRVPVATKGGE